MPLYRFTLHSHRSPDEAIAHLRTLVGKPGFKEYIGRSSGFPKDHPLFIGTVACDSFQLHRTGRFYADFQLPIARGLVTPSPAGSRIHIILSIRPFGKVTLALWLLAVGTILAVIFKSHTSFHPSDINLILALAFLVGVMLAWVVRFHLEIRTLRRLLTESLTKPNPS
jgi:hypothetical protein